MPLPSRLDTLRRYLMGCCCYQRRPATNSSLCTRHGLGIARGSGAAKHHLQQTGRKFAIGYRMRPSGKSMANRHSVRRHTASNTPRMIHQWFCQTSQPWQWHTRGVAPTHSCRTSSCPRSLRCQLQPTMRCHSPRQIQVPVDEQPGQSHSRLIGAREVEVGRREQRHMSPRRLGPADGWQEHPRWSRNHQRMQEAEDARQEHHSPRRFAHPIVCCQCWVPKVLEEVGELQEPTIHILCSQVLAGAAS